MTEFLSKFGGNTSDRILVNRKNNSDSFLKNILTDPSWIEVPLKKILEEWLNWQFFYWPVYFLPPPKKMVPSKQIFAQKLHSKSLPNFAWNFLWWITSINPEWSLKQTQWQTFPSNIVPRRLNFPNKSLLKLQRKYSDKSSPQKWYPSPRRLNFSNKSQLKV